jgi:hypothetical protein
MRQRSCQTCAPKPLVGSGSSGLAAISRDSLALISISIKTDTSAVQYRHAGENRYPRLSADGTSQDMDTGFRRVTAQPAGSTDPPHRTVRMAS